MTQTEANTEDIKVLYILVIAIVSISFVSSVYTLHKIRDLSRQLESVQKPTICEVCGK
jgi:hypothetical protein